MTDGTRINQTEGQHIQALVDCGLGANNSTDLSFMGASNQGVSYVAGYAHYHLKGGLSWSKNSVIAGSALCHEETSRPNRTQ